MMWQNIEIRDIALSSRRQIGEVKAFLAQFGLAFDEKQVDYTIGLYEQSQLVATGSLAGEVFRNIAISKKLQGEGLTQRVISCLMEEAARRQVYHYFLFTKIKAAPFFCQLGFKEVERSHPWAVLLEAGLGTIEQWCQQLQDQVSDLPEGPRACIVMNANPFTLGHQALIEQAAAEYSSVVVLVVSEEAAIFPFTDRFNLVTQGVAHLAKVRVLPSGPYVISRATFPGYFLQEKEQVKAQTCLDARIFGRYIAPALGVSCRFVGQEPFSAVTRQYNETLLNTLPSFGLTVKVVERVCQSNSVVSASLVRSLLAQGNLNGVAALVPKSTWNYLTSSAAAPILLRLQQR